jgi:hypothetical protein
MSKKPATELREGDTSGQWVMGTDPGAQSDSDRAKALDKLGVPCDLAVADDQKTPKRRTLDDMRRLSEAIKATRTWTAQRKTPTLLQRLRLPLLTKRDSKP